MALSRVAVVADVTATASSATSHGGAPGGWSITVPLAVTPHPRFTVGGSAAVAYEATCTFTFTPNSGTPIAVPVKLTASATKLKGALGGVLRHGDEAVQFGNRIRVDAAGVLRSS